MAGQRRCSGATSEFQKALQSRKRSALWTNAILFGCVQDESGCEADALWKGYTFAEMIDWVQQNLFIVQAHIAGADKIIEKEKITHMESAIDAIEKELPPIKTFLFPAGHRLRRSFDFARTLARRAERRAVAVSESEGAKVAPTVLVF